MFEDFEWPACDWAEPRLCPNDALNTWRMLGIFVHLCDTHDRRMWESYLLHGPKSQVEPVSSISAIIHGGK